MGERLLGDLRDWYEMDGSSLRHLVADQLAPRSAAYDLAAIAMEYRAVLNQALDEHGLVLDERDQLAIDAEWIDGDELRALIHEIFDRADLASVADRHRRPPADREG
ncbi:hypothetical protein AB0I60_37285 [Actinosynnema sp. NPDC050436]|uniref:hypothetical protein n=1 Tax=Actinosynnema sp. NPDC050436 TaxID=3155659 RepID=UPI0033CC4247